MTDSEYQTNTSNRSVTDEAMGMSSDTDGTTRSASMDEAAGAGHLRGDTSGAENAAAGTVISTTAGKTVWTDVAGCGDANTDTPSVHSAHSAASSSLGSKRSGGGGGGRAASMLARTRNPVDKYSRSGGGRRTGSFPSGVGAAGKSAGRRTTPRTQSFDSTEGEVEDHILHLKMERAGNAAAGTSISGTAASSEAIPEGSKEFSSQNLSVDISLDRTKTSTTSSSRSNGRAGEGWTAGGNNGSSSSMNEVERAKLTLWGIAGAGASNDNAIGATPSISQGTFQAAQDISEERERSDRGHEQDGQHSTPFDSMVQRARSVGHNIYDRGQQLCKRATLKYAAETHEGQVPRDIGSDHGDHEHEKNHPEITGGYGGTGQNHDAFFFTESRGNATSYVSDMFSLLLVLLAAPFYWLYFTVTGRDYHDRYGSPNESYGVETSQSTFGSATKSTATMSQEELYERSEVYLEAKEEDGTLFALLAFHHPGLVPLVDETVESVQLTQALGEDTVKTGDTDLAAALDPDRCVQLNDDDDDIGADDDKSRGSVDNIGAEDAVSPRSGRSRNSGRSRARSRSRSVDARIRRRDKSDDEWVYDINTQKMRRKRGNRHDRNKSKISSAFGSSIDEMSFDSTQMTIDETCSGHSGNLSSSISTTIKPVGVVMALNSKREKNISLDSGESGKHSLRRSCSPENLKQGVGQEAEAEWNDRGKTTENDRAAWKRNQNGVDSADDIVAAAMAELEDLGNAPSPYETGHEKERTGGRKGLGMSSFRKVQEGLRKSAYTNELQTDVPDIV